MRASLWVRLTRLLRLVPAGNPLSIDMMAARAIRLVPEIA
jgi:hypothetical protein